MRTVFGGSAAGTRKIDGQVLRDERERQQTQQNQSLDADRNVRPVTRINGERIRFSDLARMAFPNKTEANLAYVAGVDQRTARRWLAENSEPPADALGLILCEIMRRYHRRD